LSYCAGLGACSPMMVALEGFKAAVGFNAFGTLTTLHAVPIRWPALPKASSVAFPAESPCLHSVAQQKT
jgi:hypothetical protein